MSENEETGYAEAWRPDPGDSVEGSVAAIVMGPDMGYGPYPIVTLETPDGERAIHAFHHVLRTELARRRPKVGDDLKITYQGTRSPKSGKGNPFHVYRVVGGQELEFDWDSQLPDEERRAAGTSEPPIPSSVPASSGAEASGPATAEPNFGPLEPSNEPTVQDRAEQNFGAKAPF